jgi:hypothetical protein
MLNKAQDSCFRGSSTLPSLHHKNNKIRLDPTLAYIVTSDSLFTVNITLIKRIVIIFISVAIIGLNINY